MQNAFFVPQRVLEECLKHMFREGAAGTSTACACSTYEPNS